jgi:hypothetical protein
MEMELTDNTNANGGDNDPREEPEREEESGDVAEPDAPTDAEENDGMSTILGAEPLTGVQGDAGDE